jgi:hypothetical protein
MPPALYFPTACDNCDRAWLAAASPEQTPICPFCGGAAEVVPGESYRAEDSALFEKLERVVHDQQLARLRSHQLWTILSNVSERGRRPELLLVPVVDAIPTLQFVQEAFARDRARLAQAAGMILVTINAHLRALEARPPERMTGPPAQID